MSSNKSPANTRSEHAGSSSKQGNEQQSEKRGSSQVDQAASQGKQTGQAPKGDGKERQQGSSSKS
ncbi:MAG TPA: hypothetical protein VE934_15350 [Polaromonas sp.]|uniref:hypothetical protein n=1 Tax=Polaromonas sp. TaxID=1869339 RepID=UPI002D57CE4C|nr:hypothetical protein [Polaromonas sp.]HYW58331.1 hypothetical protein [Polaromonas sp.]